MKYALLLGAGFSRNWGGWLAPEAFEYLLGCAEIRSNARLKSILWKHQVAGGFENALAEVQAEYSRDARANKADLDALQGAISQMFDDMNAAFFEMRFEFQSQIAQTVVEFLARFDAIFTLNQDLLLERHYLSAGLESGYTRKWAGHDLPGMRPVATANREAFLQWSRDTWVPVVQAAFAARAGYQPLIKLHGSSNWKDAAGGLLLVIGGNKAEGIQLHPILSRYAQIFDESLRQPDTRLMIIGYGFRDTHINDAITRAVHECGLQIFNISPAGCEQARSLNPTRNPGLIQVSTRLEGMFELSLIGASRRSLSEIFGGDIIEHRKVMRFFDH